MHTYHACFATLLSILQSIQACHVFPDMQLMQVGGSAAASLRFNFPILFSSSTRAVPFPIGGLYAVQYTAAPHSLVALTDVANIHKVCRPCVAAVQAVPCIRPIPFCRGLRLVCKNPQSPQIYFCCPIHGFRVIFVPHTAGRPPIHPRGSPCRPCSPYIRLAIQKSPYTHAAII